MELAKSIEILKSSGMTHEEMGKAIKELYGLEGIRHIGDLWSDQQSIHAVPSVETTKTGPAMSSSGSGAEAAIGHYSNLAPQVGVTEAYNEFNKNLAGFKTAMDASVKSQADLATTIKDGFGALLVAVKEPKAAATKPVEIAKSDDVLSLHNKIGKLQKAILQLSKIESAIDAPKFVIKAQKYLTKAEKETEMAEKEEEHESKSKACAKAKKYIKKGWGSLVKATSLERFGLHGYGNQKDEAVAGDEGEEARKIDAAAKSKYFVSKAFRKALKMKMKEKGKEMAEKAAKKEAMKKAQEAAAAVSTAETLALAAKSEPAAITPIVIPTGGNETVAAVEAKLDTFAKSVTSRLEELHKTMQANTHQQLPPMIPINLSKANGANLDTYHTKADEAEDNGNLSELEASMAHSLIDRMRLVSKGQGDMNIVTQQINQAPVSVQRFFSTVDQILQ